MSCQLLNGNSLTVNANATNNSGGTITVGNGSTATLNDGLTQLAGSITVDGQVNVPSGQSLLLQGGMLAGNGTVSGNVSNAAGTVNPGDLLSGSSTGTPQFAGNYTQQAPATTLIELGGTQQGTTYDLLKVTGAATLAGSLDVELVNGFTPTVGETFDFLTYGTRTGSYNSNVFSLDNGFTYSLGFSNTGASSGYGILTVTGIAAVPETSTLLSAALMLSLGGGLLLRRRERKQPEAQQAA